MGHVGKTVTQNIVSGSEITDGTVTGADLASDIAITTTGSINGTTATFTGDVQVGDGTDKLGVNTDDPHSFFDVSVQGFDSGRRFGVGYNDSIVSIYSHAGTGGLENLSVRGDNLMFYTDYDASNPDGVERMKIRSSGDISIQKNTTGYGNITSFGTVTLADDASIQFASGTHCGGANHIYVYETGTGSNCVYYGGFNKTAVLSGNHLETGGIGFAPFDSDGNVSLFSGGSHAFYLKNREGSSKTFKILKVGLGSNFDDTV